MTVSVPGGWTANNHPLQSRLGRQQQEYYLAAVRANAARAAELRASLTTTAAVLARQAQCRANLDQIFGPMPAATPLNAQTTGVLNRAGYNVEKVLFESMPGWLVSANLYVPTAAGTHPAIIMCCGHDTKGKVYYQDYAQGLARLGYVVLIFDAIGMGERTQVPSSPGYEHAQIGRQLPLAGWSMAGLQLWDSLRALDYLLSRPEVDPTHVGVCGNSGGGTQATWLAAYDRRITMAAPTCFVTTFEANLANELYADNEQLPHRAHALLMDVSEFLLCHLPARLLIAGQRGDYFDERGRRATVDRVQRYAALLGLPADTVQSYSGTGTHGLNPPLKNAVAAFFGAITGKGSAMPVVTLETEADLLCTVTGNVADEPGAIKSQGVLTPLADAAAIVRGTPTGAVLTERIRALLCMPDETTRAATPNARVWPIYYPYGSANYPRLHGCVYALEAEPGVLVPVYHLTSVALVAMPNEVPANSRAIVYVPHVSADQEITAATRDPLVGQVLAAEPSAAFFVVDLRNNGEGKPLLNSTQWDDQHAQTAELLGAPMLGRLVWDVLRTIDFVASFGWTNIHLVGRGYGSLPASIAAVLDARVRKVTLKNHLSRWHAIAIAKPQEYNWPLSVLPFGALESFDQPDIRAELATKPEGLGELNQWGAWLGAGGY